MNKLKALEQKIKDIKAASKNIREYLNDILDEKSFVETDVYLSGSSYIDDKEVSGEGVITGYASIGGRPVYLFAQNYDVLKGSFSKAQGDKIIKTINQAVKNSSPLIAVIDSDGARVGEGVRVLEAYAAVINALVIASDDIPVISVVKGNCSGLISALVALSDFTLMSKDASMSLAPPSVVLAKSNINGALSENLGAKFHMSESGFSNSVYENTKELKAKLSEILSVFDSDIINPADDPNRVSAALNKGISVKTLLDALTDNGKFIPYSVDNAAELKLGFGQVNGIMCGIAISDSSVSQHLTIQAIDKFNRFIELLDKFNIPLITLVDSAGIESSLIYERGGLAFNYANLMKSLSISSMAKVAVICGKAIGAAYSALAAKSIGYDYVLAFAGAEVSPVDAQVAVNLLYTDEIKNSKDPVAARKKIESRYSEEGADALIAAREGYIDNVIEPAALRPYVSSALLMLLNL
ncbi:MAG: carboxyl transferase domain-containing protein [Christensenellales bacterium]|jgi:acetyl-CoA carboxylase carboxyltransferase component